jgi:hypothetical protein
MNRTVAGIADDVAAQGGILIVNHPMLDLGTACIGCKWSHVDDTPWDKVSGIEVITGNFLLGVQVFVPQVLVLWDSLLDQGFRIAAIGGSDDHTAGMNEDPVSGSEIGSPTTLVLADNLSEAAIIDAIKHGRTIVQLRGPDDPLVDMTMTTKDGATAEIGDDVDGVTHISIGVHVVGGTGTFVQLWKDGQKVDQQSVTSDDFTSTFERSPTGMSERFRIQLIDDTNATLVITSHIYVQGIPGEDGGGCCDTGRGSASNALLAALVVITCSRRRRSARRPG